MLVQFSKYFLSGGVSALVNFFSRMAYENFFNFSISLIFAYLTGLLVNYNLSRRYVFTGGKKVRVIRQYPVFLLIALIGLLVTYIATHIGLNVIDLTIRLDEELAKSCAHIFGIGCGFLWNFFGHKTITFKAATT